MFLRAIPYLFLAAILVGPLAVLQADEDAHGAEQQSNTAENKAIYKPGPAVIVPRKAERYTAQGMTLNPVAIDFDPQGNIYVAEGWRMGKGAAAIVHGPMVRSNSLPLDLQRTSIEERAEHIESLIADGYFEREYFTGRSDLLRKVEDTDGDGIADKSSIFAGGFNDKLDGVASGVLWHQGRLYFANVPHLWLLEDKDGDGDADKQTPGERTSMSYGYGLRWGYGGHDLHGLIKGPDGRIYFTMGDRGYNTETQEGERLIGPDVGSVFRMWPDGSGLEVYATGLRNPQELAFDNYGNLFTGENNSDGGDLARFCHIPEGSDAGWRQDVQSLPSRGAWNREHMWEPPFEKGDPAQPAWIMPPLANVGRGPSGIAHYPGTGDVFPKHGSFLMCDYPAGVRHVLVQPDGAGFKVVEDSKLPTDGQSISDVAWGYDGRLYISDWGGGWGPNDKHGHLKVMTNEAAHQEQAEVIAGVKRLFAEGFEALTSKRLLELLAHPNQKVRLEAQWEIAKRPQNWALWNIVSDREASELARLHALQALGMKARVDTEVIEYILPSANDPSPYVRAQAAVLLGELGYGPIDLSLIEMLDDEFVIVQSRAAIGLGKTGNHQAIPYLLDLIARNNNNDVVLRHAASYGLSLIADAEAIHQEAIKRGPAERLGAVLALRHLQSPLLAEYVNDDDLQVSAEAVRAIYDRRINEHLPTLAALADSQLPERMVEPIMRRVIEANVRLADADSADRLAKIAANADAPEIWRALALKELTNWSAKREREDVWGWWHPRPAQPMAHASAAMQTHLPAIKASASGDVLTQARVFELTHILKAGPEVLASLARDRDEPDPVRMAGMQMLAEQDRKAAVALLQELLTESASMPSLRSKLRTLLRRLDWRASLTADLDAFHNGTIPEQQEAIHVLATNRSGEAQKLMVTLGERLQQGELAPELRLDAHYVLTKYKNLPIESRRSAQQYAEENTQPGEGPFIREASLVGGSAERGRDIFLNNNTAQCQRCHAADGRDAVGPGLNGIATVHDAGYLYEALVHPNAVIARGFANVSTQSMMPAMTDKLTPLELRDVIAYLGTLTGDPSPTYRRAAAMADGVTVVRFASGIDHAVWLPAVLLGIAVSMLVLLALTIVTSRMPKL